MTFSLDVFFDFSEDVPNGMLCFEGPTPDLVVSDPGQTMVPSRREQHFFQKLPFRLDEKRPSNVFGAAGAPQPLDPEN